MLPSVRHARRAIEGAIGTGALAGAMLFGAAACIGPAGIHPRPRATTTTTGVYGRRTGPRDVGRHVRHVELPTAHPAVNDFFTSLKGQPKDQISAQVQTYLDANPQVRADLQGIREPSVNFRERCGVPQTP